MEDKKVKDNNKFTWRNALEVWAEISTWIAVPIIAAVVAGKWIDRTYGSEPWGLIGLAIFGFLVSSYGIVRAVKRYAETLKQEKDN